MDHINTIQKDNTKKRIAIINKKNLLDHPYDKWILDADPMAEVYLFTQDSENARKYLAFTQHKYAHIAFFKSWNSSRLLDVDIAEMHKECPFDRIVSLSECDVTRASELRDAYDINGMKTTVARAYRDKIVMKQLALNAGLKVPRFAPIFSAYDLIRFSEEIDGPIVVKPVDSAGSVGVCILYSKQELLSWIKNQRQVRDEPMRFLAEEFIDAPIVTVDGIMASGKIITAMSNRYHGTCLDFVRYLTPMATTQQDITSGQGKSALEYASKLIAAFPTPDECTSFHLELFDTESGPILCEIGSRTGGARFGDVVIKALGINLEQWSCLGQAGYDPSAITPVSKGGEGVYGHIFFPRRSGFLVSAPSECPLEGVIDYRLHFSIGERMEAAQKITEPVADAVFKAIDIKSLYKLYEDISQWYIEMFRWSS